MASEQTLKAVKLAREQEISEENQEETECQEETREGVFKEDKVVRKFQEERKSHLCLILFRVVKQCQEQKHSLDFEQDQAFITHGDYKVTCNISKSMSSEMVRGEGRLRRDEK